MELVDSLKEVSDSTKLNIHKVYETSRVSKGYNAALAFVCQAVHFAHVKNQFGMTGDLRYLQ